MRSFFKIKSVDNGMALLLDDFCKNNNIKPPEKHQYTLNEHITFGEWLNKIKIINQQYKEEGLGLDIGALVQPSHMGILAYIAQFSNTLADYIKMLSKYEKLWFNYIPKNIHIDEKFFSITWDKPAYLQAGLYIQETAITEEILVSIFYHHLQQLLDIDTNIFYHLELTPPRPYNVEKYTSLFKCSIEFNAKKTKIILPITLLDIQLKNYDPILLEILLDYADNLLDKMPKHDSFIELVNLCIIQSLDNNNVQINTIAKALNTTPRMLQKELKKRESSFKEILNNIRKTLAKKYLQNRNLSITEVAFLLAYKDQTSFNRAFKIWNGVSPSTWRKNNLNNNLY